MTYFTPPPFPVRMFDAYGSGVFGAPRSRASGTRPHLGTDYVIEPGQPIPACVEGRVTRACTVYPDSPKWKGVVIKTAWGGELKLFYVTAYPEQIGADVGPETFVGQAQDIRIRYPKDRDHDAACTPHVHGQMTMPKGWPIPLPWVLGRDYIHYSGRCYVNLESLAKLNR